jgi:hypothetical protein
MAQQREVPSVAATEVSRRMIVGFLSRRCHGDTNSPTPTRADDPVDVDPRNAV